LYAGQLWSNFWLRKLGDEKFGQIPDAGGSGTKNLVKFRMSEALGRKIWSNSGCRKLGDEKFGQIPDAGSSGEEKIKTSDKFDNPVICPKLFEYIFDIIYRIRLRILLHFNVHIE
jgi:hypothetical protein